MKTFLLFALAVASAIDVCEHDRMQDLAEATCGDKHKKPVCTDATGSTSNQYIGRKAVRMDLMIQNIVNSDFVTKIEYKCPYNDTMSFHEPVYSHQTTGNTHIFKTSSGTQIVVTHNRTVIYNDHNDETCESTQEGMQKTPDLYGIFDNYHD